ncbi:MAG: TolC family protein [Polyangiales bacterium]
MQKAAATQRMIAPATARAALVALAATLGAGTSFAQPVWTDARVARAAAARAPAVREARAALDVAAAGRVHGERPFIGNPTVGVLVLPGFPDFGAWTTGVSVGLPIDVSGLRGQWSREAARGVLSAEARLGDETLRAVAEARAARVALAVARAQVAVQRERLGAADEALTRTRARADARAATAVDLALAEQERAEAAADLARAERAEAQALGAFRSALDLDADAAVEVDAPTPPAALSPDEATRAMRRAPEVRGDARALDEQAARLDAAASRVARAAVAPVVVGFEAQQVAVGPQELNASVGASLRWELPLVQRAQGDRAVAEAEARASRTDASLLRRQVGRDVTRHAETLARALTELDALEGEAIPAAGRLAAATEAAFAAGAIDYFRVLAARREVLSLRSRALEVLEAAWAARLAFERARGETDAR